MKKKKKKREKKKILKKILGHKIFQKKFLSSLPVLPNGYFPKILLFCYPLTVGDQYLENFSITIFFKNVPEFTSGAP